MVASADDWRSSDGWGIFESENLEEGLRQSLKSLINLPPIESVTNPKSSDLALEMIVVKHRGGEFDGIQGGDIFIPVFWRPKVEVKARLYNITTGKTLHAAGSIKKTSWSEYFRKTFSLNGIFRFKPLFNTKDMEILLCRAGIDVLQKLTKKL